MLHPRPDDAGRPVLVAHPSAPTPLATWFDPAAIATVVPDGPMPASLAAVAFEPWPDAPRDDAGWRALAARGPAFVEPRSPDPVSGRPPAAGAVVVEPDGRVWIVHPSNRFGGYDATFPKGKAEHGHDPADLASLRALALREVHEETGLRIELVGWLVDAVRSTTVARFYLARRVGGTPADMGWESQAVSLVPTRRLARVCTSAADAVVRAAIPDPSLAGAAPPR